MPYYRHRRSMGRRSFASGGGSLYASQSRANFKFRRHILESQFDIPANRARIIPFLAYTNVESLTASTLTSYSGDSVEYYPTHYVLDGSRVRSQMVDFLIKPTTASDADVIEFYTARIICSFHDVKSGDVRGLQITSDDKVVFQNDAKNLDATSSLAQGIPGPSLDWSKLNWDISYTLQHWWRGIRKSVMAAGQPLSYHRREWIPRKCIRSNPGMFYGMVIMNDSPNSLNVDFKQSFDEVPLVQ